jgi:hypothetical protein
VRQLRDDLSDLAQQIYGSPSIILDNVMLDDRADAYRVGQRVSALAPETRVFAEYPGGKLCFLGGDLDENPLAPRRVD